MSRFTDSPYFLLKDYISSVHYVPPEPEIDPVNFSEDVAFNDYLYVSSSESAIISNPFVDVLSTYNPDDAVIFAQTEVEFNVFADHGSGSMTGSNAHFIGPTTTIVVRGGQQMDLFAKIDDVGFVPIILEPSVDEPIEKRYFNFTFASSKVVTPDITETVIYDSDQGSCSAGGHATRQLCEEAGETWTSTDEAYYDSETISIQQYDYTVDEVFSNQELVESGVEIYIRKDSNFHKWLEDYAHDYYLTTDDIDVDIRGYVNSDKHFLYFGKIYQTAGDGYQILFTHLKDYVEEALPQVSREPVFVEFLEGFFDKVYSESYESMKNVWSLRDAMECDDKFLSYIPKDYNMDIEALINEELVDVFREYSRDLVNLLKRKGSYASLKIVYDLLTRNSDNILTIQEKWHHTTWANYPEDATYSDTSEHIDNPIYSALGAGLDNGDPIWSGFVPVEDIDRHIYTSRYGVQEPQGSYRNAGSHWYASVESDDYPTEYADDMLSTGYRVDVDLNTQPYSLTRVVPKEIAKALYDNWEKMRPVHRSAEYNYVYAPSVTLSGEWESLYVDEYTEQSASQMVVNKTYDLDNFIHVQRSNLDQWVIEHNLGTEEVIVQAFDSTSNQLRPAEITITDGNTVTVDFDFPSTGIILITRGYIASGTFDAQTWTIKHAANKEQVIIQTRTDAENKIVIPDVIRIDDVNTATIEGVTDASTAFVARGVAVGDVINGVPVVHEIVYFDTPATQWIIDHPYIENAFVVQCYDENNELIEPSNTSWSGIDSVDITPPGDGIGDPIIVIDWDAPTAGFVAFKMVGNLNSFDVIPRDEAGAMLSLEWKATIETDEEIFTFMSEDERGNQFTSEQDLEVTYESAITGTTDIYEEDTSWNYYTFKISNEALEQKNIKDFYVREIALYNNFIGYEGRRRIFYSKMSGIYKVHGSSVICHVRISKSDDTSLQQNNYKYNGELTYDGSVPYNSVEI